MLSGPLLVLSVATAFTDESWNDNSRSNGMEGSQGPRDSQAVQEADSDVPFLQSYQDTGCVSTKLKTKNNFPFLLTRTRKTESALSAYFATLVIAIYVSSLPFKKLKLLDRGLNNIYHTL